eukprot:TRINITY_DN34202_c0_g1_i2.p1 TRINITY_DN34202_c0_g1~~TRINITY_DN34202_c0_g1_i2.p1  ORF type:complete len:390 (-),score=55.01 TRINITY_DN34202_c0_g1_i2:93-1262(-)
MRKTAGPLRRLALGSSELRVTDCGLGTMTWGLQTTEKEAHEQLDYAVKERGVNFVDTSEIYPVPYNAPKVMEIWQPGLAEEILGKWFAANPAWRQRVIVSTSVSGYKRGSWAVGHRNADGGPPGLARLDTGSVRKACEASLRRLQTDYIDVFQVQWPDRHVPASGSRGYNPTHERKDHVPIEQTLSELSLLIADGSIRHYGIGNETAFGVCAWASAADTRSMEKPVSISNAYSLMSRDFEESLAECCAPARHNLGLVAWGALHGGVLTGKYAGGALPKGSRSMLFPGLEPRYRWPRALQAADEYCKVAADAGISPATLALQWCQSRWFVSSTIIGATKLEQLKENIDAFDGHATPALSSDVLKAVDRVFYEYGNPSCFPSAGTSPGQST